MKTEGFAGLETALADLLATFAAETVQKDFHRLVSELTLALADGHSCLPVTTWQEQIALASGCADESGCLPLTLFAHRLYLSRYFHYEKRLAANCRRLAAGHTPWRETSLCARLLPQDSGQRQAAEIALRRKLCLISGGPGTGKTSTVAKIIALLLETHGPALKIALCAPTGKAAMRLKESVMASLERLPLPPEIRQVIPRESHTLHRLLGARAHSPHFRHNSINPLPYDLVIVDEASMADLALMSKLTDALPEQARLILLGDQNQLASVESGAVFAEMLTGLPDNRAVLTTTYRFNPAIGVFANSIRQGNVKAAWTMAASPDYPEIRLEERASAEALWAERLPAYMEIVKNFPKEARIGEIFAAFRRLQTLCATRTGAWGVTGVNQRVERLLRRKGHAMGHDLWYSGRPVLLRRNDFSLGLYNGDLGICLPDDNSGGGFQVWFDGGGGFRRFPPWRLPEHDTAWAITIHQSQGSECAEVLLILPNKDHPVLSRELLYTGVTRARDTVRLMASQEIFRLALERPVARHSGLAAFFSNMCEGEAANARPIL
ncbi:MAG: exodeoxyribonuclease V subunit alpha [Desulfobulbaceae bacterium]|jgi:exodeoxyribonuclease V alpha subunit|nr:exodeoxyribonuclease V subunit alpha [Desulfobulbaceae bacterium]